MFKANKLSVEKPLASKLFTNEIGLIIKCIQHTKMSKKRTHTLMGHQSQTLLLHFTFELKSLLLHLEHILHNPRPVLMLHRPGREGYQRAGSFTFRPLNWSATGTQPGKINWSTSSLKHRLVIITYWMRESVLNTLSTGLRPVCDRMLIGKRVPQLGKTSHWMRESVFITPHLRLNQSNTSGRSVERFCPKHIFFQILSSVIVIVIVVCCSIL